MGKLTYFKHVLRFEDVIDLENEKHQVVKLFLLQRSLLGDQYKILYQHCPTES
jgi:hypothetical protein